MEGLYFEMVNYEFSMKILISRIMVRSSKTNVLLCHLWVKSLFKTYILYQCLYGRVKKKFTKKPNNRILNSLKKIFFYIITTCVHNLK